MTLPAWILRQNRTRAKEQDKDAYFRHSGVRVKDETLWRIDRQFSVRQFYELRVMTDYGFPLAKRGLEISLKPATEKCDLQDIGLQHAQH